MTIYNIQSISHYNAYIALVKHYKDLDLKISNDFYTELHHILPKCMGGTDDSSNLVRVPANVHYELHKLLAETYKTHNLNVAWAMMSYRNHAEISKEEYEASKMLHSEYMRTRIVSSKTRQKMSASAKLRTGDKNPFFGKTQSNESKAKIANKKMGNKCGLGYIHTHEARLKMSMASASRTGDKNPFFGQTHSQETKDKISKSRLGKTHSDESKQKMSLSQKSIGILVCPHCNKIGTGNTMKQWHFDNCKLRFVDKLNV